MRITNRIRDEYEALFKNVGEGKFYGHVLGSGALARNHLEYPEIAMIDQSDGFFALYRATGNIIYFNIGRVLRRAAHKLYREGRKKNPNYPVNKRFITIVK
jgi:hypothetical protein